MRFLKKSIFVIPFLAVALMISCDKEPVQQLKAAKDAVTQAKKNEADKYAKQKFNIAHDNLNTAIKTIEEENKKLPFLRDFKRANNLLLTTISLAESSSTLAINEKERIRIELANAEKNAVKPIVKKNITTKKK